MSFGALSSKSSGKSFHFTLDDHRLLSTYTHFDEDEDGLDDDYLDPAATAPEKDGCDDPDDDGALFSFDDDDSHPHPREPPLRHSPKSHELLPQHFSPDAAALKSKPRGCSGPLHAQPAYTALTRSLGWACPICKFVYGERALAESCINLHPSPLSTKSASHGWRHSTALQS
ncbi:uncharacterized protein VTP21DRAFT_1639 [Calcarisporiella thermophila]|uniref:uncharacterized protein n=1 Tax=Calcarisporiella thermophila TaxID=911321 RepID=UPI0037431629